MKTSAHHRLSTSPQAGVSLVELLVGLAIGLLVSIAAIGSMSSTRATSTTVSDSTRLHQDAATAFRTIGHHLRQAGAQQLSDVGGGNVEFNSAFEGYGAVGSPQALRGTDGPSNAADVLEISHDIETSINAADCLGQTGSPAAGISNRFDLDLVNGSLRCLGSSNTVPGPLIGGVEDFQVRYGVRTNDNLQYQNAPADWNTVEAVMVCLRLVGEAGGHTGDVITGCRGENIANDGRIRRTFVRVFSIRNVAL
jgi:type IV pilus assembly protein PilW